MLDFTCAVFPTKPLIIAQKAKQKKTSILQTVQNTKSKLEKKKRKSKMCLYFTHKYTLCGCIIYDDRSMRCGPQFRMWCPGAEIIQAEYEGDRCCDCPNKLSVEGRVDFDEREEKSEMASSATSSSSSSAASVVSKEDDEDGGYGRAGENLERRRHVRYMQCDVSRVCDPVAVKRGGRVRRTIHGNATWE